MTHEVVLSEQASKFLRHRPREDIRRIMAKLEQLAENPFRFLGHHEGQSGYKLRIGSFRALCDVDTPNLLVRVRLIDKRGRIYKR